MQETVLNPGDYLAILNRRKLSLLIPSVVIIAMAAVVAIALPSVYKSTSTILIEEKEIPEEFVMTTVNSYAEQRLQMINQRIMSTSKLQEVIKQFNLYAKLREKRTNEEIIKKMRDDIELSPISVEVKNPRTGQSGNATIAFTLSYELEGNAEMTQRVASVLANLFLEENLKVREEDARGAAKFLKDEMDKIKAILDGLEDQVGKFKEKHTDELPELMTYNMQSLASAELEVRRLESELRSLKEKESAFKSQLANLTPTQENMTEQRQLDELRLELVRLQSRFTESYPDVVKVKQDIAQLERQMKNPDSSIVRKEEAPDPAYVNVASQLASVRAEIDSVARMMVESSNKVDEYRKRLAKTSGVESEYRALVSERESIQLKYQDITKKYMEASTAAGLEKEQKGERFTLIDPAQLPEKPYKPNRLAIMIIGIVLGLGAGVGTAALLEFSDLSVRTPEQIFRETAIPVLACIPAIVTEQEVTQQKRRRTLIIIGSLIAFAGFLVAFHFLVMDFDVLWARLMRRIG